MISLRKSSLILLLLISCAGIDSVPTDAQVTLEFVHVGDDGVLGLSSDYDFRYTDDPALPFSQWIAIPEFVVPKAGLTVDTLIVNITFADDSKMYYFAAKAVDEAGNWSATQVIDSFFVNDLISPADVVVKVLDVVGL